MNIRRLDWFRFWYWPVSLAIAVTCNIIIHVLDPAWFWYVPLICAPATPAVVYLFLGRRTWKGAASRPVFAVLTRPVTGKEKAALGRRGYNVDNMYVHGTRMARSPSDAVTILEQDLMDCMSSPFEVEEMATSSPGTARRVVTLAGKADDVLDELLGMMHEGHGDRP